MWFGQNPALRLAAAVKMDGAGLEIPKTVFFADENVTVRVIQGLRAGANRQRKAAKWQKSNTEAFDIRQTKQIHVSCATRNDPCHFPVCLFPVTLSPHTSRDRGFSWVGSRCGRWLVHFIAPLTICNLLHNAKSLPALCENDIRLHTRSV
jgi:hypothetical protein